MTRTPLRPLARIIEARQKGENPDAIERENLRLRHEASATGARARRKPPLLVGLCFLLAFGAVGARMGALATTEAEEPRVAVSGTTILNTRADIVDRQGRVLATNFDTNALYAHPHEIVDPAAAAAGLAEIFPDMDAEDLERRFTSGSRFIWLRRYISPEQEQMVHDLGEPGFCSARARCGFIPTGPSPRISSAARASGRRR
jgi:cell division protein FtsI (penicillin-binding protein 3)